MDEKTLKRRLLSLLPAASLHMSEFLSLTSIRLVKDDSVTNSACVTNEANPTLYLNENFLEAHCQSDEHLLMLVMHEMYHIVLGHTRLYKLISDADNIAFDAVINAALCRTFKEEKYISFFKETNSDESPIGALLRPIGEKTPESHLPLLKELYQSNTVTYYELYQMIRKFIVEAEIELPKHPASSGESDDNSSSGENEDEWLDAPSSGSYTLLGGHKGENVNPLLEEAASSSLKGDLLDSFLNQKERWGSGGEETFMEAKPQQAEKSKARKMKRLLDKALPLKDNGHLSTKAFANYVYDGKGVIPNFRDRTALARISLGITPLLYKKSFSMNRYCDAPSKKTIVYLDVSGSVTKDIGELFYLLRAPYQRKQCDLYAFSTEVSKISYADFKNGRYSSTRGTDISCVMDHYFSLPKKKRGKKILILTDGFTRKIEEKYKKLLKQERVSLYCGFFGEFELDDLKEDLTYYETLGTPYDFMAD